MYHSLCHNNCIWFVTRGLMSNVLFWLFQMRLPLENNNIQYIQSSTRPKTCSCHPAVFVQERNDETTIFFDGSNSWFEDSKRLNMICKLEKDPNFDPMGISRTGKLKMKLQWISYFRQLSMDENRRTTWTSFLLMNYQRHKLSLLE